jgi:hypothetical protein
MDLTKVKINEVGKAVIEILSLNFADKETAKIRLETCIKCPNEPPKYDNGWCKECECKMSIKTKLINFKCPLGHW